MLGIGAIEIEEATYSLGMCGHIVVRINATGQRYMVNHTMSDGWQVSSPADEDVWTEPKRMTSDEFVALLPPHHGWCYSSFIAVWAGFAAGFEYGIEAGKERERQQFRPVPVS